MPLQKLRELVTDCWDGDAEARPTFEDIVHRLEDILKDLPKHSHFSKNDTGCACSVQ